MQRSGTLLQLAPDNPVVLRLAPGSRVSVTAGTVWLTQEGMIDDIVLTPGREFVVPLHGTQVVSAVDTPATARIADIHAQARALRRRELRRLVTKLRLFFRRGFSAAG